MSELEHFGEELYEMEERIRRLAISCNIELTDANIVAIIRKNFSICPHGPNAKSNELRGLLMMKYNIEEHCIESVGAEKCLQIVTELNEKLKKHGFKL